MSIKHKTIDAWKIDIFILLLLSVIVFILSSYYDILEAVVAFSNQYEHLEIDEFITMLMFLFFGLLIFSLRRLKEIKATKDELQKALTQIKELKGIIPICASCKSIRNDDGFWEQVDVYIQKNTDAQFTHGLCQNCINELYPEFAKRVNNSDTKS